MKNKRKIYFIIVPLITLLIVVSIIKFKQNGKDGLIVTELVPVYGSIEKFISTTGVVEPQNRLEIKPPIGGRIDEIFVEEGDNVKSGDVLSYMSSTERAALMDAARGESKETLAYWQEVYKPIPLIAPIAGEVIVRAVEPGQTVNVSSAVFVLSDRLIVKAYVDETDIGIVTTGQKASLSLDAYPSNVVKSIVGHIAYESKLVNNVTIYEVDIVPEHIPDFFRSGMSATINIIEERKENVLILPLNAVKRENNKHFVLVLQSNGTKPVRREITLGISDGNNAEVVSGISAADTIIIERPKKTRPKKMSGTNPFMPFSKKKKRK